MRQLLSNALAAAARWLALSSSPLSPRGRGVGGEGRAEETEVHDTEAAESMAPVLQRLIRRQAALPADDEGLWEPLN